MGTQSSVVTRTSTGVSAIKLDTLHPSRPTRNDQVLVCVPRVNQAYIRLKRYIDNYVLTYFKVKPDKYLSYTIILTFK